MSPTAAAASRAKVNFKTSVCTPYALVRTPYTYQSAPRGALKRTQAVLRFPQRYKMKGTVSYNYAYVNSKTGLKANMLSGVTLSAPGPAPGVPDSVQFHLFDSRTDHHRTWGFYCDRCERFFDLTDGTGLINPDGTCDSTHTCGQPARYVSFPREY